MSSFAEVMAEAMAKVSEKETPNKLHPIAQRMELTERFKRYHTPENYTFTPGLEFVREKQGLGYTPRAHTKDLVRLFWRYLDQEDAVDFEIIRDFIGQAHMSRVDCLVAELTADGSSVVMLPHDTALLEVDTDA